MPREGDASREHGPDRVGLDVEPRRIGIGPASRLTLLAAIVAAVFLLATVVRPWAASDLDASRPTVGPDTRGRSPASFAHPPRTADIEAAARPHDDWGIRAIVVPPNAQPLGDGTGTGLEERWSPADLAGDTWDLGTVVSPARAGDVVVGIGITTPPDRLPLDIRVWRLGAVATPRRIVAVPVPGPDPGSWLWLPDPADTTVTGIWPPGTYRLDVLLGSGITRLVTIVPGDIGSVAATTLPIEQAMDLAGSLRTLAVGPIAVVGDGVMAVDAEQSQPLDEYRAWLASTTSGSQPLVALIGAPNVSALGVALPEGARDPHLWIEMLTPIGGSVRAPVEVVDADPGVPDVPTPDAEPAAAVRPGSAVLERAGTGSSFAAGVYELTASWTAPDGSYQARVWHVEIAPSVPPTPPSSPLQALGRWMGLAAIPGTTIGEPIVTDLDAVSGPGTGTCGAGATITPADRLLGVEAPFGAPIIAAHLSGPDGAGPLSTRLMAGEPETGGLALVALPSGGLAPGRYRLGLDRPSGDPATYEICVG